MKKLGLASFFLFFIVLFAFSEPENPETIKENEPEIVISSADDREPVKQEAAAEKSGAKFPLWFLFPLLLFALIAALVYLLSRRKKSPSDKPAIHVKTKPVKFEPVKAAPVKVTPAAAAASITKITVILDEEIRRRAYELYQERGSQHGNMARDWYDALSDVCAKYKSAGYRIYFEGDHWWAS